MNNDSIVFLSDGVWGRKIQEVNATVGRVR